MRRRYYCSSHIFLFFIGVEKAFQFLFSAVYHLKIKSGNQKNAGTSANVWTCIHGDKSDTGRIDLKRSGIMESLFEPDQTDYFTISANDIGRVSGFI